MIIVPTKIRRTTNPDEPMELYEVPGVDWSHLGLFLPIQTSACIMMVVFLRDQKNWCGKVVFLTVQHTKVI